MYLQLGLVLLLTIALHISDGNASESEVAVGAGIDSDLVNTEMALLERAITNYTNEIQAIVEEHHRNYSRSPSACTLQQRTDAIDRLTTMTYEGVTKMSELLINADASRVKECSEIMAYLPLNLNHKAEEIFNRGHDSRKLTNLQYAADYGLRRLRSCLDDGRKCITRGESPPDHVEHLNCLRINRNKALRIYMEESWKMEIKSFQSIQTLNNPCNLELKEKAHENNSKDDIARIRRCIS